MMNKDALLEQMDSFINEFTRFRAMLETGDKDGMQKAMRESTARRSLFDKPTEKAKKV